MTNPSNVTKLPKNDIPKYPAKRYSCVVMDPPWPHMQRGNLGAIKHYDLMSVEDIANLPIPELLTDDAHVWIWCFVASRLDAQRIAEQKWGLTFRSELIWDKRKTGLGNYLRGSHEHLLLFTKGRAPVLYKGQRDVADWPVQEHSHKPEEAMVAIQRLSPGPYLELFARRRFPGFDAWGNEAPGGSDLHIPGYPVPAYSERALNSVAGSGDDWADGVMRKAA
ncbi:MAG: MT-A70 family methyltransferase [Dehalococcoidia bacterium]|jgi:N6-adenosine-specific RNA methylase IME4